MKLIKKINKKAYKQIAQIRDAHNMLEVESSISRALLTTFGLWDLGLIKIAMRNGYAQLCKEYGCVSYKGNFELLKAMRNYNFDTYQKQARVYLMSFIPERMRVSEMYKNLQSELISK